MNVRGPGLRARSRVDLGNLPGNHVTLILRSPHSCLDSASRRENTKDYESMNNPSPVWTFRPLDELGNSAGLISSQLAHGGWG